MTVWPRMRKYPDGFWVRVDGKVASPLVSKNEALVIARRIRSKGETRRVEVFGVHTYVRESLPSSERAR